MKKAVRKIFQQIESIEDPLSIVSQLRTLILVTLGIVVFTLVVALIALGLSISAFSKGNGD